MINVIKLQENVRDFGQRVERFAIDVWTGNGWKEITQSTTIGFRKMLRLSKLLPLTNSGYVSQMLASQSLGAIYQCTIWNKYSTK